MNLLEFVGKFEKFCYGALIVVLMVFLVFALGELVWVLKLSMTNAITPVPTPAPTPGLLQSDGLTSVLGTVLLVLIGIELLDTMMEYFRENAIHVEIVVLLAIIAVARKVILLNPGPNDGFELIGIGVVIIGLSGAYYMIKKAGITFGPQGLKQKE
jgi:uncharacterized membrane protein (DUF373 family)